MLRSTVIAVAVLACAVSFVSAETQERPSRIFGKVTEMTPTSVTILANGDVFTFVVDANTQIIAKGASHKTREAAQVRRSTALSDFIKLQSKVTVTYEDMAGQLLGSQIRVIASPELR